MADGGEIAGAAAGAAGTIPALIGRGQNKRTAGQFYGSQGYDPNASQYGGHPGGAAAAAQGYGNQANTYNNGAQYGYGRGNAGVELGYGALQNESQQARAEQMNALALARGRATGQVPSISGQIADEQARRLAQQQASAAASARGPAALALAQQNAANNTATGQSQIANQAGIAGAQERLAAEQAYANQAGNIRSGDVGVANSAFGGAGTAYSGAGSQGGLGATYSGLQNQVNTAQLNAGVQNQGILAGSYTGAEQSNQRTGDQNAQSKGFIQTIGDFFSDERAKYTFGSDFTMKNPVPGLSFGGGAPGSLPFTPAGGNMADMNSGNAWNPQGPTTKLSADGAGMDVMGTIGLANQGVAQAVNNPGSSGVGSMMLSDAKAKQQAFEEGMSYAHHRANADTSGGQTVAPQLPAYMAEVAKKQGGDVRIRPMTMDGRVAYNEPVAQLGPREANVEGVRGGPENTARFVKYMPETAPAKEVSDAYVAGQRPVEAVTRSAPVAVAPLARGRSLEVPAEEQRGGYSLPDVATYMTSDFTAKRGLSNGPNGVGPGDPNAPKFQFGPRHGWTNPGDQQDSDILARTAPTEQDKQDVEDNLALNRKIEAQTAADAASEEERKRYNAADADAIRKRFYADNAAEGKSDAWYAQGPDLQSAPQPGQAAQPQKMPWWAALGSFGKQLNQAQFGDKSDERAKVKLPPSDSPVADANRTMHGQPYVYKPEHTPKDQAPGELNFGFMAQNLEKNPISATAVKEDETGMKRVDAHKMIKVMASGIADLQQQQDELRLALAKGGKKKG